MAINSRGTFLRAFQSITNNFLDIFAKIQSTGRPFDPLLIKLLVQSATEIDRDSHELFLVAKSYFDVSSEFLINQAAGLADLLLLQTDGERDTRLKILANQRTAISNRVMEIAAERWRMHQAEFLERQQEYAAMLESIALSGGVTIGKRR